MSWSMVVVIAAFVVCGLFENVVPMLRQDADRDERWPSNFSLMFIVLAWGVLNPLSLVWAAEHAKTTGFGLMNVVLGAPYAAVAFLTVLTLSLLEYGAHVVSHKVPLLWRIHRVHHLDTHLDISTAHRQHPFALGVGLIAYIPLTYLLGLDPAAASCYLLIGSVASAVAHANIRLPRGLERLFRTCLVTPSVHRLHHSASQAETDSNYGEVFNVWDRLFGTYRTAPDERCETMTIGLSEVQDSRAANLWWQLKSPFLPDLSPLPHGGLRDREPAPVRNEAADPVFTSSL